MGAGREEMQRLARPLAAFGHTLRPPQQGQRVMVIGDGWGGDNQSSESYEALVTEADFLTYTVVALGGARPWSETHVLKSCCVLLADGPHSVEKPATSSSPRNSAGGGCRPGTPRERKRSACHDLDEST